MDGGGYRDGEGSGTVRIERWKGGMESKWRREGREEDREVKG